MNKLIKTGAVLLLTVVLAGCGGETKPDKPARVEDRSTDRNGGNAGGAGDTGSASKLPGKGKVGVGSLDDPSGPLSKRVIYFEYDKSTISEQGKAVIVAHASYLAANPNTVVELQGHTDERGSREYNVALGERRAKAVRRLMLLQGVTDKQIKFVSYGEERPANAGHDESAWKLNRRVELKYQVK